MSMIYTGRNKVGESDEDTIIVDCKCGTHLIKITSFNNEPEVYIGMWSSNFCTKQKAPLFSRIWDRLKLIWFVISGKEYLLEEIILDKNDVAHLEEALKQILENKQEVK